MTMFVLYKQVVKKTGGKITSSIPFLSLGGNMIGIDKKTSITTGNENILDCVVTVRKIQITVRKLKINFSDGALLGNNNQSLEIE